MGAGGSQAVDNEALACNWLQSNYECQPGSATTVSKMELYKRYVSACSVCGLQQIVSPTTFATCIRYHLLLLYLVSPNCQFFHEIASLRHTTRKPENAKNLTVVQWAKVRDRPNIAELLGENDVREKWLLFIVSIACDRLVVFRIVQVFLVHSIALLYCYAIPCKQHVPG